MSPNLDRGELLLRLPIARRTRLASGVAGIWVSPAVAATAETDFDIRRNGTGIATMRFAAATDTARFTTATETVLEPGGVLSVVPPPTPDATLADIWVTLAAALVL